MSATGPMSSPTAERRGTLFGFVLEEQIREIESGGYAIEVGDNVADGHPPADGRGLRGRSVRGRCPGLGWAAKRRREGGRSRRVGRADDLTNVIDRVGGRRPGLGVPAAAQVITGLRYGGDSPEPRPRITTGCVNERRTTHQRDARRGRPDILINLAADLLEAWFAAAGWPMEERRSPPTRSGESSTGSS